MSRPPSVRTPPVPRPTPAARAAGAAGALAVLAVLWAVITEGDGSAWPVGIPAVALAALALARTGPLGWWRLSPLGLGRFIACFLAESLAGGLDVARRVLGPELRIRPGVQRYRWRLPPGAARALAIVTLNLQPGTLAVRDEGEALEIHLLDRSGDAAATMRRLESRIAAMLRLELGSTPPAP